MRRNCVGIMEVLIADTLDYVLVLGASLLHGN